MNLIALAVPFFLLALLVEFMTDRVRGTSYYRGNDAINSLSAGILSESTGYFTKLVQYAIWGYVLGNLALFEWDRAWFDLSLGGILLWIFVAVAWDFCYYWNHRLGHEISILWAAHAVHHQSEEYNLSTALRQTSTSFLFSWIFYLPLFVIGIPADVIVTVGAINLIYQFWVHTRFVGRLGVLDRLLVTPSNHRVHHAQNEAYIDKNYGGIFIIWDRIFGTFAEEDDDNPVVYGVRKPLANWNPFWANFQVYDYLMFDARHTQRWRDKIGVWLGRTGWRPADVEAEYPKMAYDPATFEKYDPGLTPAIRRYIFGQFAVVVAQFLAATVALAGGGLSLALLPCLLLWVQLYTLGLLNDGRAGAARAEGLRLVFAVPPGVLAFHEFAMPLPPWALTLVAVYVAGSLAWLTSAARSTGDTQLYAEDSLN